MAHPVRPDAGRLAMPAVTVELPSLLAPMVGDARSIPLTADTLRGALDALIAAHPSLGVHLFDEAGYERVPNPVPPCLPRPKWCEALAPTLPSA